MSDQKDEALARKYIAQKLTVTKRGRHTVQDMTLESAWLENITPELKDMLNQNKHDVIENYDARGGEDGPYIVITERTNYYPVDFVDYR